MVVVVLGGRMGVVLFGGLMGVIRFGVRVGMVVFVACFPVTAWGGLWRALVRSRLLCGISCRTASRRCSSGRSRLAVYLLQ